VKITIEERSGEILFFLQAETVAEAALLVRVGSSVISEAAGYVNYSHDTIRGWVSVPLARNRKTHVKSGHKR
jgi:hypothetical protein